MDRLEAWITSASDWIWGPPLLILLMGGGAFFLIYSRFLPFRYFPHGISLLKTNPKEPQAAGEVSHLQALSVALAATIGMGNIASVAIAIQFGGPGVIFWMWVSAILGMATKYFTCSLAVMYRTKDEFGKTDGGPMHVIKQGLGRRWHWLAYLFCTAGLFGCLPVFNANQLTQATEGILLAPMGFESSDASKLVIGIALASLTTAVMFGGLSRIANVVTALVPLMVGIYFIAVLGILIRHVDALPQCLALITGDAFAAQHVDKEALFGGTLLGLILIGAQRAAFSNEAGIGTAPMAHGAAKTNYPVHEGLVAMLGPVIDTLLVCSLTAMAILVTGAWQSEGASGITITSMAFEQTYPELGKYILLICILCFGTSSMFSYSYFGSKCFRFLFGSRRLGVYSTAYIGSILWGAITPTLLVVGFIDTMYAIMALPTVLSAVLLAPRVIDATKAHFGPGSKC